MKIIIAGSRGFKDKEYLFSKCDELVDSLGMSDIEVVSGGARGADYIGEEWAGCHMYPVCGFPALWETEGISAGHQRNARMAKYADMLVAFWDRESRGTAGMIEIMKKKTKPVHIFTDWVES